ncbi:hypothetical protein [Stenotrophomonas sp.]|uniref:hypothetical protein n=1 Tax=Stenotrophomonas sp. TaxID=69392 RepID=UPI0028A29446|nr:hypothetical protein [Stenotrophomonas sp.]
MKETITQDLAMAAAKVAPAAGVTVGTYSPGYTLSDVAVICTILFTLLQAFAVVVKNWGDWTSWGRARWATVVRIYARIRRRG